MYNHPNPYDPNAQTYTGGYQVPPVQPKRTLWRRFRARRKRFQLGIGCLVLLVPLIVCGIISTAIAAIPPTVTATPTVTHQIAASVSPTATIKPTPRPTSKPTVAPTPKPVPTRPPAPKPTPKPTCVATNNNPWCYNFTPGNLIYSPPSAFCDYFNCIASFWTSTKGYVDECNDGTYSHSGGRSGDCSDHGGKDRPLYSH
jgi:hypothetical protein